MIRDTVEWRIGRKGGGVHDVAGRWRQELGDDVRMYVMIGFWGLVTWVIVTVVVRRPEARSSSRDALQMSDTGVGEG